MRWIERHGRPAPIEFSRLLHLLDGERELLADIDRLLERKRAAPEMGLGPPVPLVGAFIESELARLEGVQVERRVTGAVERLNEAFRAVIGE